MTDLILQIRAQVLKANIERLRQIAKEPQMERRYREIDDLCANIENDLTEHKRNLDSLSERLRGTAFRKDITTASQTAENILNSFLDVRDGVRKLIESATRKVPVRPKEPQTSLDSILDALAKGDRQAAWQAYRTDYPRARRLLSEYLEFMGGWALRDVGLDEGICDLADKLLPIFGRGYSDVDYKAVTIPARQETVRMTWARILRMGSPEWTVWALPLITHDIWFAMAQETNQAQDEIDGMNVSAPWIQECLADAYAIWATGPAYAYALFYLRLDPFHAWDGDEEHAGDGERAEAVLQMWNLMGSKEPLNPYKEPYIDKEESYIDSLTTQWREALKAAKPDSEPQTERLQQMRRAVNGLFNKLTYGGYSIQDWNRIQTWPAKLSSGKAEDITLEGTFAGLHWVLNAAWLARIKQPDKFETIGEQARLLWNRIQELSSQQKPPQPLEGIASRTLVQTARRA